MTSDRQRKRKINEITRSQDACKCISVKKSANGTSQRHPRATESIKIPHLEPQIQLHISPAKIKLQLFPINEQTCLGLQKDGHNPFLELTLSARKRISSVIKHLNSKWGSSSVVIGELMLFPYDTKFEQLASCRRWTPNDSAITAWELYVDAGCPSIFRLRYGWFSNLIPSSLIEARTDSKGMTPGIPDHQKEKLDESGETIEKQMDVTEALCSDVNDSKAVKIPTDFMDKDVATDVPVCSTVPWDDNFTNLSIGGLLSEISLQGKINGSDPNCVNKNGMQPIGPISDISVSNLLSESSFLRKMSNPSMNPEKESSLQPIFLACSDVSIGGLLSEASLLSNKNKLDTQTMEAGQAQIQFPWDDNITTLSIGGLLSEVSLQANADGNSRLKENKSSLQPNAPLSDSFCSFISNQLNAQSQMPKPPPCHEPTLSIFDAEETCHAFPIRRHQSKKDATTTECSNFTSSKQFQVPKVAKINNKTVFPKDSSCQTKGKSFVLFSESL